MICSYLYYNNVVNIRIGMDNFFGGGLKCVGGVALKGCNAWGKTLEFGKVIYYCFFKNMH